MADYTWYVGDKFVPSSQAVIPITDLAVSRGYGVFGIMRTYNGKPFHLQDHLNHLRSSAELIGLTVPYSDDEITSLIQEILKKNALPETYFKFLLTGGPTKDGILPIGKPIFAILVTKLEAFPSELYTNGVKIITYEYERLLPEAKTLNYLQAVIVMQEAIKQNASEVLYIDKKGMVLELTRSNIFVVQGDTLITPRQEILAGITRNIVMDLAAENDYTVDERDFNIHFLYGADEVFMTATNKEIVPIVEVDTQVIADGAVGPVTKKIIQLFHDYTRDY